MDQSRQGLRSSKILSPTSQVTQTVYLTCISNTGNFEFTVYEDFLTYKSGNTNCLPHLYIKYRYLTCISNTGTSPVYQIQVTLSLQSTRISSPTSQVTYTVYLTCISNRGNFELKVLALSIHPYEKHVAILNTGHQFRCLSGERDVSPW